MSSINTFGSPFRFMLSGVTNNDVISLISQIEMHSFPEKGTKNLEKSTTYHSQLCNLLNDQQLH